jgi:hypothetical protein
VGVFSSVGSMHFEGLFQDSRWCVANIWQFNIVLVNHISTPHRWWSVMPSTNVEHLNSCCDSCVRIKKVEIYVAWVMHLHLCLLGCAYYLLACWSCCHMLSRVKGITKVYAI